MPDIQVLDHSTGRSTEYLSSKTLYLHNPIR